MAGAAPVDDEIAALLIKDAADRASGNSAAQKEQLERDSKLILESLRHNIFHGLWPWGEGILMIKWKELGENRQVSRETRLANLRKKHRLTWFDMATDFEGSESVRVWLRTQASLPEPYM